jgi:hypothetical protein
MTGNKAVTAPNGPLVEKVARAMLKQGLLGWSFGGYEEVLESGTYNHLHELAQAAIAACHAEEMLDALREAVVSNRLRPPPYRTVMPKAEALLAELDIKPTGCDA